MKEKTQEESKMKALILDTPKLKAYKIGDEKYLVDWIKLCNLDGVMEEKETSVIFDKSNYWQGDEIAFGQLVSFVVAHVERSKNDVWWELVMNLLLDCLYHGYNPDEESWAKEYQHEIHNMKGDFRSYLEVAKNAGIEVDVRSFTNFLVYAEAIHISNDRIVGKSKVNVEQLEILAAMILEKIKEESK